jgi:integrase
MARSIYSEKLKNRTNRLKLPAKRKPYKVLISPGVFLAYRRNAGRLVEGDERQRKQAPGTWSVECGWLKRFALADDFEDANNQSVMSYHQALQRALKLARGSEGDRDKPITVAEALDAYETDLAARGGAKYNATSVRNHLSSAMLSKVVMLLKETELRDWRNGLVVKGLKLSSANRTGKSFKAALALAASRDKRITNSAAWRAGLKPLKAKGSNAPPRDNYYLPDATILAIVRECYVEGDDFGALIDLLAGTGVRESQALSLWPDDLQDDDTDAPRLMMHCSAKGRDRDPEQRMLPITPALAQKLRARAIARPRRPLFDRIWNMSKRFRVVLERLGLDLSLTPYTLRHSSVIRQIRSGTPLRIIAFTHDTSVAEIEKTYGRFLNVAADDARKGLLADEALPAMDNVVKLAR